jgi:hypothetical protein
MSDRDLSHDTLCVYCSRYFASHANLVRHIKRKHPGTYAEQSYAKEENK